MHGGPEARQAAGWRITPAFLDGFSHGPRFGVRVDPAGDAAPRGSILCVQALGDEAGTSRRVLAAQARRLATRGWTTLMVDLFGTGDSAGRQEDASLSIWRADLLRASSLARERCAGPFVLWGLRTGALLAADIAIAQDQLAAAIVFWEPTSFGAASSDGSPAGPRASRELNRDLGELALQPPLLGEHADPCPVLFVGIDPAHAPMAPPPRALSGLAERWLEEGYLSSIRMVAAKPFWEASRAPPRASLPGSLFETTETFLAALETPDGIDAIR